MTEYRFGSVQKGQLGQQVEARIKVVRFFFSLKTAAAAAAAVHLPVLVIHRQVITDKLSRQ